MSGVSHATFDMEALTEAYLRDRPRSTPKRTLDGQAKTPVVAPIVLRIRVV
jgi:hypothetical protein